MKIKPNGFTLIELMVVLVIVGVLMAYGLPSYQRQVIVSKRTEAKNVIMQLASAEEKHNANFNNYTVVIGGTGTDGNSLGITTAQFLTSDNYDYSIAQMKDVDDNDIGGYVITADAKGNTQVNDNFGTDCTSLTLNSLGVKLPLDCWQ